MGYLNNAGSIIVDATLSVLGRQRLARSDGSFSIVKFALSDQEINYGLYDKDHPSGSAYYDLEIMELPVFEAVTEDNAAMGSRLITILNPNLLYLPVLKLNEIFDGSLARHSDGVYIVAVDDDTENELSVVSGATIQGIMLGEQLTGGTTIRVDQGMDTNEIPPTFPLDSNLKERQYLVRLDNRFGKIASTVSGEIADVSFVDDDDLATYILNLGTDPEFVKNNTVKEVSSKETLEGPRGTFIQFRIQSSLELNTSEYLFDQIGTTGTMTGASGTVNIKYIDATVRVEGVTTGMMVDIPVRFVKKV
jgi:hypothetical protein